MGFKGRCRLVAGISDTQHAAHFFGRVQVWNEGRWPLGLCRWQWRPVSQMVSTDRIAKESIQRMILVEPERRYRPSPAFEVRLHVFGRNAIELDIASLPEKRPKTSSVSAKLHSQRALVV